MNKCLGCGVLLQTTDKYKLGYTTTIDKKLCYRCFRLKHYGEYLSVPLSNNDYQKIINNIKDSSLIVYLADLLTLDLSKIPNSKKVLLVLTKRDILPKSIKDEKIIKKIKEKYSNILDVIIISSIKNYHIDTLYNAINRYSNEEIYLIGNTNSGKSTLINQLIKNYGEEGQVPTITVSMYPSTTLDKVEIKLKHLKLIDTPGLIEEGNYTNILSFKDLKKITPKKEIKPRSCQVTGKGSILIGEYARIDYETTSPNSFVIYTSPTVVSNFISPKNNILKDGIQNKYSLKNNQDIVLPGLGFIKCKNPINMIVYTPKKIKPYTRDNLI